MAVCCPALPVQAELYRVLHRAAPGGIQEALHAAAGAGTWQPLLLLPPLLLLLLLLLLLPPPLLLLLLLLFLLGRRQAGLHR